MIDLTYIIKICGNAINILIICEIGFYLFANRRDQLKGLKRVQNQPPTIIKISMGFFLFFLFSALGFFFYILEIRWWYIFPGSSNTYVILNNIKMIFLMYAFSCLFIVQSSILIHVKFQVPTLIVLIVFPFFLLIPFWVFNILVLCVMLLCILPLIMLYDFIAITKGKLKKQFFTIFIGLLLFVGGCIIITHLLDPFIQFTDYSISEPIILVSLIFMGYGFISMPSFNEAFPAAFVEELYLTTSKGNIILKFQYKAQTTQITEEDQSKLEEEFIGSSIVGIDSLLREISSAQGLLKTLVHQNKILIVERATTIVGVFVTRMDLRALRSQLTNLLQNVETKFLEDIQTHERLPTSTRAILNAKAEDWFKEELSKLGYIAKILFYSIHWEIFDTAKTSYT